MLSHEGALDEMNLIEQIFCCEVEGHNSVRMLTAHVYQIVRNRASSRMAVENRKLNEQLV